MKKRRNIIITGIVCLALLTGIAIPVSIQEKNITDTDYEIFNEEEKTKRQKFEVHYIDVGQADSALILCDEEALLIDGGTGDAGERVSEYLQDNDVEELKYMIGTHPHEDHIGGLDTVMESVDTETLLIPDLEYDTDSYYDVVETATNNHVSIVHPEVGDTYPLGEAVVTVLAPVREGYVDTNNYSIVVRIDYQDTSFLFTGDAEIESEYDMMETGMNLKADVLKVGHHGSATSTSEGFIQSVCPSYAVISVGKDNSYGHPAQQTLNRLSERGIPYYRTDEQGTVIAYSDGENIGFMVSKTYIINK